MEQLLRHLTVRLEASGTALVINNTKLYKGSFGFVSMRALVPVTQNRAEHLKPLCTVHAVITDSFGVRRQLGRRHFNMKYVENTTVNGFDYMIFERKMPKIFTDDAGDLDLVYNYSETTSDGKLSSRLTTNVFHTRVEEGGEADGEIDVDLSTQESAQINANTLAIGELQSSIWGLTQPPDTTLANNAGVANVEILADGRLSFQYLKGEKGDKGEFPPEDYAAIMNAEAERIEAEALRVENEVWRNQTFQSQMSETLDAVYSAEQAAEQAAQSASSVEQSLELIITDQLRQDANISANRSQIAALQALVDSIVLNMSSGLTARQFNDFCATYGITGDMINQYCSFNIISGAYLTLNSKTILQNIQQGV